MASVSDILKLLDQVPVWKTLRALPRRVDDLERRLAALEAAPGTPAHVLECAECGAPARVTAIKDHPTFGPLGVKLRTVSCENGHAHDYKWTPDAD